MKTLLIMRHGYADNHSPTGLDHDRPLALSGKQSVQVVGRWLRNSDWRVDRIHASTATRASDTARIVAAEMGYAVRRIDYGVDIYSMQSPDQLLQLIHDAPADCDHLLIVGHDPHLSGLLSRLNGHRRHPMPPGAIAGFRIDVSRWPDLTPANTRLLLLAHPLESAAEGWHLKFTVHH